MSRLINVAGSLEGREHTLRRFRRVVLSVLTIEESEQHCGEDRRTITNKYERES